MGPETAPAPETASSGALPPSRRFLLRCVGETLLLGSAALVAGLAAKLVHPGAPAWFVNPETDEHAVTRAEVRERWSDEVLWVDARSRAAFEAGHASGALRLALEEWDALLFDHFDSLASAERPIVVYCDGAKCGKSKEVAAKLRDLGIPDAHYLVGGWQALAADAGGEGPRP
jgi:rhodanese-related sulfurtransferase